MLTTDTRRGEFDALLEELLAEETGAQAGECEETSSASTDDTLKKNNLNYFKIT